MLTQIKIRPVPSPEDHKTPPASSMIAAAEASLKGKQLLCGRVEAHLNRVTGEDDAARKAIAQVRERLSRQMIEGADTTAVIDELTRLENHRRALEAVLTIAKQKHAQAQDDVREANRQAVIAADVAACDGLRTLGPRGEEILAAVKQFSTDVALATDALRLAGGNDRYASRIAEIKAQFQLFLGLAKHPLTNNGAAPTAFMKYKSFSDCLTANSEYPRP